MNTRFVKLVIIVALLISSLAFARPALAAVCESPVTVVSGDTLFKIALRCGTSVNALLRANPDITNRNVIRVGQKINLPGAMLLGTGSTDIYIIAKGDTLNQLAVRFNTTVDRLLELNADITNASRIYEGQRLVVPKVNPNDPPPSNEPGAVYTVVRGDTLRSIAEQFDTTVETLLRLNPSITNANNISVGQKIILPAGIEIYTVVRGDTLRAIAQKFGTTVSALLDLNSFIDDADLIYPGQVLRVK